MSDSDVLSYEFPCNEKIRTYLRLEALFHRFDWLAAQDSPVAHHCAIGALFDLTDATARSDLRNELVQGLERRRQQTEAVQGGNPIFHAGHPQAVTMKPPALSPEI